MISMMGNAMFSQSVVLRFIIDLNLDPKDTEEIPHPKIGKRRARTGEYRVPFGLRS